MATKKTTGDKLADMIYGTPTGAAFGVYPQAGKRGQRKLTAKEQLAQIFSDDRAMELPKLEDYDLSVPTMENLALSQRISARQADLKRQADEAMSPLEKLAGGMQAGRLIGSGMYQAVKSLPTAITKGGKAAEEYIAENIYKPNQPKAYEYAEDVGNFLQSLESDYKIPPIIPEAMVLQNVIGPATRQAGRAAQQGARQGALNLMAPNTLNPQAGVIKMKGGNWLGGSIEKALEDLKRPDRATGSRKDPKESMAEMKAIYTPEALSVMSPETQAHVARAMDDLERKIALNNWVDSNLYGYIKNDMATPQDPVRLMIERRMAEIDQKFAKDMERVSRVEQRAAAEADPRRKANFDRQAQTARAEAEAERDTAMKYASHMPQNEIDYANQWIPEDLALSRMNAGFPTEGLGQSNTAKGWEAITDSYIHSAPASKYVKPLTESEVRRGFTSVADANPWLSKLDPDTPVQYLKNADSISQDLRLDHIMDVLREDVASGRIRPEQLSKVSMEQAVRRTAEYDQELATKMAQARIAQRDGLPVYKEYPEGYRWVELNRPGVFASESEAMGHSVRGYEPPQGHPDWVAGSGDRGNPSYGVGGWEAIKSGKAKVYSLVDSKGEPHVTVEVQSGKPWNERSGIFYDNPELEPSWQRFSQEASLEEKAKGLDRPSNYIERYPEWLKVNDPEMYEKHAKVFEESPPLVRQIKGKGNERPVEKYDPFTQDFVKGGKWSKVDDLQNTGLFKLGDEYMTEAEAAAKYKPMTQEALNFLETHPAFEQHRVADKAYSGFKGDPLAPEYREVERAAGTPVSPNVPYTYRELRALLSSPEDWTDRNGTIYDPISKAIEKLNEAKKELGLDLPPTEGMAHGGRVHISDNPDVMMLELAGGGLVKRLAKGVQNALPAAEREANKAKFLEGSAIKDRVHHGTNNDIRKFNDKKLGLNTDSNASSEGYAQTARVGHWFNTKPMGQTPEEYGAGYTVDMPVHLSIKNPKRELSLDWLVQGLESKKGRAYRRELEEQGYDGIVLPDEEFGGESWVAFRPEQIKSAIGNRGTYDIEDPDINKADGGAVRMQVGGLAKLGTKGAAKGVTKVKNKTGLIASDLIDEDPEIAKRMGALARAKRQAAIEAEGKRQELAKQTQPSVGYRKSTPLNPDPLVGTRFVNEAPFGLNPNEPFDLSKFKGASGLVLPWDSQSRNVKTTQVSGVDLPNQIFRSTHGGVPYSFDTQHAKRGIVGASGKDISERIKTRSDTAVRENIDRGGTGELLHFPITMGFRGEDYALPYSEFSFELINHKLMTGELTLKQAMELSNMVRNYTPPEAKYKGKKPFADFAGFTSPEGLDQIYTGQGIKAPSGDLRKAIADRIIWQKGSQEKLGFNAEDLMNATTYEPLRGVDKGFIGSSVMRNTPSGMRLSPSAGKYPYDTDFSGEHLGRLLDNVNAEALFYRTLNPVKRELMDRETKKPYTRESLSRAALGAIEKRNENVSQMIDQQFLDDYDTYITELRKPTEYKKGGRVRKYANGGEITADDLILEERKL